MASVLPSGAAALGTWTGRLRRAARTTITVLSQEREVYASVGVAAFSEATTPTEALAAADAAMYIAKAGKR